MGAIDGMVGERLGSCLIVSLLLFTSLLAEPSRCILSRSRSRPHSRPLSLSLSLRSPCSYSRSRCSLRSRSSSFLTSHISLSRVSSNCSNPSLPALTPPPPPLNISLSRSRSSLVFTVDSSTACFARSISSSWAADAKSDAERRAREVGGRERERID